jgi:hypothetical protein
MKRGKKRVPSLVLYLRNPPQVPFFNCLYPRLSSDERTKSGTLPTTHQPAIRPAVNSATQLDTVSTASQKVRPDTSRATNQLSPSEIESLRAEHKRNQAIWSEMLKGVDLSHLKST